jgi:hypothetical protein
MRDMRPGIVAHGTMRKPRLGRLVPFVFGAFVKAHRVAESFQLFFGNYFPQTIEWANPI